MGAIALKGASGSSDSLSGDEVITFTARKSSSKFFIFIFAVVVILVYQILLHKKRKQVKGKE